MNSAADRVGELLTTAHKWCVQCGKLLPEHNEFCKAPEILAIVRRLEFAIQDALNELGVPQPMYPAPITNAVELLMKALSGDSTDGGNKE